MLKRLKHLKRHFPAQIRVVFLTTGTRSRLEKWHLPFVINRGINLCNQQRLSLQNVKSRFRIIPVKTWFSSLLDLNLQPCMTSHLSLALGYHYCQPSFKYLRRKSTSSWWAFLEMTVFAEVSLVMILYIFRAKISTSVPSSKAGHLLNI